jgi:hypothetical protein
MIKPYKTKWQNTEKKKLSQQNVYKTPIIKIRAVLKRGKGTQTVLDVG